MKPTYFAERHPTDDEIAERAEQAAEERIVEWLRSDPWQMEPDTRWSAFLDAAAAIERGDHRAQP